LRVPVPGEADAHVVAVVSVEPHPYFTVEGDHLGLDLPVTFAEAALGATVTVPTLEGPVTIRIPPGTRHGRTLRIRGRGLRRDGRVGDLLAHVEIVVPHELSDAERGALAAFAAFAAATGSPRTHFPSPE
jgi:molecular chaperone DnaJ